jgi:hypothetical protein
MYTTAASNINSFVIKKSQIVNSSRDSDMLPIISEKSIKIQGNSFRENQIVPTSKNVDSFKLTNRSFTTSNKTSKSFTIRKNLINDSGSLMGSRNNM